MFYHSVARAVECTVCFTLRTALHLFFWFLNNYYALIILFLMRRTFCVICRWATNSQHLQHRRYMHALFIYRRDSSGEEVVSEGSFSLSLSLSPLPSYLPLSLSSGAFYGEKLSVAAFARRTDPVSLCNACPCPTRATGIIFHSRCSQETWNIKRQVELSIGRRGGDSRQVV